MLKYLKAKVSCTMFVFPFLSHLSTITSPLTMHNFLILLCLTNALLLVSNEGHVYSAKQTLCKLKIVNVFLASFLSLTCCLSKSLSFSQHTALNKKDKAHRHTGWVIKRVPFEKHLLLHKQQDTRTERKTKPKSLKLQFLEVLLVSQVCWHNAQTCCRLCSHWEVI